MPQRLVVIGVMSAEGRGYSTTRPSSLDTGKCPRLSPCLSAVEKEEGLSESASSRGVTGVHFPLCHDEKMTSETTPCSHQECKQLVVQFCLFSQPFC